MFRQIVHAAAAAAALGLAAEAQITFESPVQMPTGSDPEWVALGDWTGDGMADLAVTVRLPDRVLFYADDKLGNFTMAQELPLPLSHPKAVVAGDFDRDGSTDYAIALYERNLVLTLLNDGEGGFTQAFTCAVDPLPTNLVRGDLDLDGNLDLVCQGTGARFLNVLMNKGDGEFLPYHMPVSGTALGIALGEFDLRTVSPVEHKAKQLDLAVALEDRLDIYSNRGDGTFERVQFLPLDPALDARAITTADLTGDRIDDIIVGESGHLSVFRQVGRFEPRFVFGARIPLAMSTMLATGDLDRDGDVDLVASGIAPSSIAVIENRGEHGFGDPAYVVVGADPHCVTLADIDSTRSLDLVVANHGSSELSILYNAGGRIHANAVARNGRGSNRECFAATGMPVLGTTWMAEVDTSQHPGAMISYVLGYDTPLAPGILTKFGEVLVDVFNGEEILSMGVISTGSVHPFRMEVPADPALIGFPVYLQAAILGGGAELCNAIDVVLGF